MKRLIKRNINRITEYITGRIIENSTGNASLAENIAYRVVLETMMNSSIIGKVPHETFYGISDEFWFWLNTEGVRRNSVLRNILPGFPDEFTQELFTGAKGDAALVEAFYYYKIFKEQYQKYRGNISGAHILDYGCGWGRITRFFIKDVEGSKIWGCDPLQEMIKLCKELNKWCNFEPINATPPTSFKENTFDLIYSFSVFSHLSEDWHLNILEEIHRILKPGGLYITSTRNRQFIESCANMRKHKNSVTKYAGLGDSSQAFPDTLQSLRAFDQGSYCHHSFNDKNWPYWGETAIPKKYVLDHWTQHFTFIDFLEVNTQNLVIVQKPF